MLQMSLTTPYLSKCMETNEDQIYSEDFPLNYEVDATILMHRDSHFSGSFDIMLEYYRNDGIGAMEELPIERIEELAEYEKRLGQNIAPLILTESDAEKVGKAREAYNNLREMYSIPNPKSPFPLLIADLILTEDAEPEAEIAAIVKQSSPIVPTLIEFIESDDYYDPLFPGYGMAPQHALTCLQRIGDKKAIIALFESIGRHDFFNEDIAISALWHIGKPAKDFLLRVLRSHPYNEDNERAAIALIPFKDDPEVSQASFQLLKEIDLKQNLIFASYLALGCEGLQSPEDRQVFKDIAHSPRLPKELKVDMDVILKTWQG